mmetsp:Transcript_29613/g.61816  ORF Transcript_29613/g.61816 Transcript_29613/m.61816 type:complete len:307 (+) Transcript_29613:138-1058(+)
MSENDSPNDNAMEEADAVAEVVSEIRGGEGEGSSVDDTDDNAPDTKDDGQATQDATTNDNAQQSSDKKRSIDQTKIVDDDGPLPTLPLKRARTAYFIFADEKRGEVKRQNPGEGVATIAKAIGALWSNLQPNEKEVYETTAANERERVSKDMQRLKDAGMWPESGDNADGTGQQEDDASVIFPIGRIRKICKLDPDVKGMSKESTLLITKATELFCTKLGKECVTMAQMQNRRKLMPEDVVEVCSIRERFMFLKPDLVDLRKAQMEDLHVKEKENGKDGSSKGDGKAGEDGGATNTLDSYFGKVRN